MASTDTTEPRPPTRVVLVRHGESVATVRREIGGPRTCRGLSDLGRRQAERLATRLTETGEVEADRLVSSHYPRAIETAEALAPVFGLPIDVEPGFGEHDPGPDLDGTRFDDYVDRFGAPDFDDPQGEIFPGGETKDTFHRRVDAALERLLADDAERTIVIACHGGVIDAVFRRVVGAPAAGGFNLFTLNTSITELLVTADGRWNLTRYNDTAHLAGLERATPRWSDSG
ncbi:MAG: histidine phosphatase family protein [Ilumatobacteraceae bacterium]